MQIIPAEFRANAATDVDQYVKDGIRRHAIASGYTPVSDTELDWHVITEDDIRLELAAQRSIGIDKPGVPYKAGDWRVRGMLEVAEDQPHPDGE